MKIQMPQCIPHNFKNNKNKKVFLLHSHIKAVQWVGWVNNLEKTEATSSGA